MLSKIKKSDSEGFTIIEVMIVLAVAAMILLIVLLAVPALTRSSKNTSLKNDVTTITGGISTWESDNNGDIPNNIAGTGTITIKNTTPEGNAETIQIGGGTTVTTVTNTPPAQITSAPTTLSPSTIVVETEATCGVDSVDGSSTTPSADTFAVFYETQTSAGNSPECINS